jgi:hypothetical protein
MHAGAKETCIFKDLCLSSLPLQLQGIEISLEISDGRGSPVPLLAFLMRRLIHIVPNHESLQDSSPRCAAGLLQCCDCTCQKAAKDHWYYLKAFTFPALCIQLIALFPLLWLLLLFMPCSKEMHSNARALLPEQCTKQWTSKVLSF